LILQHVFRAGFSNTGEAILTEAGGNTDQVFQADIFQALREVSVGRNSEAFSELGDGLWNRIVFI